MQIFAKFKMLRLLVGIIFASLLTFGYCSECEVQYECINDKEVLLNKLHFACPENFDCNHVGSSCAPCVRAKCNRELLQFACDTKNERLVKIGKYGISCMDGYKCNSDLLSPCEPCISKDDMLEQPFVQPKDSTATMNLLPRDINVGDADLIDCNDGKSFLQPCRPGPTDANYYFKCTLTWNFNYALSIHPCNTIYLDKLCRKLAGLCLPPAA